MRSLVQQIQIGDAQISVRLNRTAIVSSVMPDAALAPIDCRTFGAVDHRQPSPGGKGIRLVIGNGAAKRSTTALPPCSPARSQCATCSLRAAMTASTPWRFGSAEARLSGRARTSLVSFSRNRPLYPGWPTARRADVDAARSALQESALRLAGAAAAPRIYACLRPRLSHQNARHLTGPKRAERHLRPSCALCGGFASLEGGRGDWGSASDGYAGGIPTPVENTKI